MTKIEFEVELDKCGCSRVVSADGYKLSDLLDQYNDLKKGKI